MSIKGDLIKKIQDKALTMGVCGLGYVGLPLAVDKAKHGFKTIGFDVQQEKVDLVNAGKNYIGDVVDADLEALVGSGMLRATSDFGFVKDVDFIAFWLPRQLCPGFRHRRLQASDPRLHRGPGIHHLSRHHGRAPEAHPGGGQRPQVRGGLLPGLLPGAHRSRQPGLQDV